MIVSIGPIHLLWVVLWPFNLEVTSVHRIFVWNTGLTSAEFISLIVILIMKSLYDSQVVHF
jgi:hypothetical protein